MAEFADLMKNKRIVAYFVGAILCSTLCQASNLSMGGADHTLRDSITVQIFFHRGHYDIDPNFSSNEVNLSVFFHSLDSLSQRSCIQIDSIVYVRASSSPEGRSDMNLILSHNRASTLTQLFRNRSIFKPEIIDTEVVGEDWDKLGELLSSSALLGRGQALGIVENTPRYIFENGKIVGGRKKALMDMWAGRFWRTIDKELFPLLRQATLTVYYTSVPLNIAAVESTISSSVQHLAEEKKELALKEEPQVGAVSRQKPLFALKTNLLYDVASLVNLGLEVPLGNRFSLCAEAVFPWWKIRDKDITVQMLEGTLEGRYWLGKGTQKKLLTGFFAGVYAGVGLFDFQLGKLSGGNGVQGNFFVMGGLSAGYAHVVSNNLRMEYSLGLGYLRSDFREYISVKDTKFGDIKALPYPWDVKRISGILPTKLQVSLVWMLSCKKGGGR